jgi:hypothetical protein
MALTILSRGERKYSTSQYLHFDRGDGSGYCFDLTADATTPVFEDPDGPGIKNFALCALGVMPTITGYHFEEYTNSWWEPTVGRCACGREVVLEGDHGHGIDCECGRIYNGSGQELAPRSQWEDRWDEDSTQPYNVEFGYAREEC